ncbi:hypothetical protein BGZ46_002220 [Entomortierella lignicola]|nr:hypothetical protein BGZ46_002220 [Entomortierella lignicola]
MATTSFSAVANPCPPSTSPKSFTISRRKHSKLTSFFLSLTIACCLLSPSFYSSSFFSSSTSSSLVYATPIHKDTRQLRQRSIAQQVHHVQFADESVHNTIVLLKKSIQKKRLAQQLQQEQQQSKKLLKKRQLVVASPSEDIRTETQDVNQQIRSTDQQDTTASSSDSTKTIPSKKAGTHLFSAFETIVFSESQIPVFLSQDHRQQRLGNKNKNKNSETIKETKQQQRQVSAITDKQSNYVQDGVSLGNENDYVIDSTRFNVALSKRGSLNTDDDQQQDNAVTQSPSAYIDDDKNSLVTSSNQVQDKEYQLNNDALPTPVDQEPSFDLPHHGHRYQNYAYIYHGCASTPAFLLVLFPALLLVAYRVYLRKQRQDLTLLPTDIKSSSSLSSPVLSDADLKIPRRASESLRDDKSCFVGYNI